MSKPVVNVWDKIEILEPVPGRPDHEHISIKNSPSDIGSHFILTYNVHTAFRNIESIYGSDHGHAHDILQSDHVEY